MRNGAKFNNVYQGDNPHIHDPILQVEDKSQQRTKRGVHGDQYESGDKEDILSMTRAEIYMTRRKYYT